MYETHLECIHCGEKYDLKKMFEGCPRCKKEDFLSNVTVSYDYEKIKEKVDKKALEKRKRNNVWKYKELLPITLDTETTLGEGGTPLLECTTLRKEWGIDKLAVKDESRNPTHTFKDRLAAVGMFMAKKFNTHYIIAGGGNTAAAASAYSAKYGAEVISFENLYESKQAILQTRSYGGKIVYLKQYDDRYMLMKKCVDTLNGYSFSSYTLSPAGDPYGSEGYKTVAYELCEQWDWESPDMVIVPTGQGIALYGIWKGFVDLHTVGLIDTLPKMVAAESTAAGSLTRTLLSEDEKIREVTPGLTIARQTRIPKVSYKGYRAVKDSNGNAVMVEDEETMSALLQLARKEGIYSSTTSAVVLAAARKLKEKGEIDTDTRVVCVITGGGLKDPDHMIHHLPALPDPIEGNWKQFKQLMNAHYTLSI